MGQRVSNHKGNRKERERAILCTHGKRERESRCVCVCVRPCACVWERRDLKFTRLNEATDQQILCLPRQRDSRRECVCLSERQMTCMSKCARVCGK